MINVVDYGAHPDGGSDSHGAINDAISHASTGETIFFPDGQYLITGDIVIDRSVNFLGETASTKIFGTSTGIAIALTYGEEPLDVEFRSLGVEGIRGIYASEVLLQTNKLRVFDCWFDGCLSSIDLRSNGNAITGLSELRVERTRFLDSGTEGLNLLCNFLDDVLIHECTIDGFSARGIQVGKNVDCTSVSPCPSDYWTNIDISHNTVVNGSNESSGSLYGIIVYGRYARIANNHVANLSSPGSPDCEGIFTKVRFGCVTGNTLVDAGRGEAAINIKGTPRGDSTAAGGYMMIVSDNAIYASDLGQVGIGLRDEDILCTGNVVEGTMWGIRVESGGTSRNIRISENLIREVVGPATIKTSGIHINDDGASDLYIENNVIDGVLADSGTSAYGIRAAFFGSGLHIRGNRINDVSNGSGTGERTGIGLATGSGATIYDVVIEDNVISNTNKGVNFANSVYGVVLANNILPTGSGITPVASQSNAHSLVLRQNKGYVTENSGTATALNGNASVVVTHGLAVTPQFEDITVTANGALSGPTQWYVSAVSSTTFTVTFNATLTANFSLAWRASLLRLVNP